MQQKISQVQTPPLRPNAEFDQFSESTQTCREGSKSHCGLEQSHQNWMHRTAGTSSENSTEFAQNHIKITETKEPAYFSVDQSLDINKAEESYDESRNQHLEALVKGLVDSESSFKHRPSLEESKQQVQGFQNNFGQSFDCNFAQATQIKSRGKVQKKNSPSYLKLFSQFHQVGDLPEAQPQMLQTPEEPRANLPQGGPNSKLRQEHQPMIHQQKKVQARKQVQQIQFTPAPSELPYQQTAGEKFVTELAHQSKRQRKLLKEEAIKKLKIEMPVSFSNQKAYLRKLKEIIETEGKIEQIKSESYAEESIPYRIHEHREIVMWLDLELPDDTDLKSIRDDVLLQVLIKRRSDDRMPYTALGNLKKVVHLPSENRRIARLEIGRVDPLDKNKTQVILAQKDVGQYETELAFRVRFDDTQIKSQIAQVNRSLNDDVHDKDVDRQIIERQIWSAQRKSYINKGKDFQHFVGMENFNPSQKRAIFEAVRSRLTLIQGPPGTGKTKVIAGIVANKLQQSPSERILVCTTMNYTADLLAETIYKIDAIKDSLIRTCSHRREDIFNVNFDKLREYSILYKLIYDVKAKDAFIKEQLDQCEDMFIPFQEKLLQAKHLVEYYFGNTNYHTDSHLRSLEDQQRWVEISDLQKFNKLRSLGLTDRQVYEALEGSGVVEAQQSSVNGCVIDFQVRRRLKQSKTQFLGFNGNSIKEMNKRQFDTFLKQKRKFEQKVTGDYKIIVTTCGTAATKLIRDLKIKTVVIDEATQVKEHESYLATLEAEQIILVGDQNQLGPTLEFQVSGPTSMYQRLIQAQYPWIFLDTQYRMHPSLLKVPNQLFYNGFIQNGYEPVPGKVFLGASIPFLFIDVRNGREQLKGTSFINKEELSVIDDFTDLVLKEFSMSKYLHKFTQRSIYVITPYNAQKNAIAERFRPKEMDEQVISIDSSQGREYDIVFISTVRTNSGNFLSEYNRINVAITRAKHGLVIVGNARALSKDPKWDQMLRMHSQNVVNGIEGARRQIEHWAKRRNANYAIRMTKK